MCGRYSWFSGSEAWETRLDLPPEAFPSELKPRFNAAPGQRLPIVVNVSVRLQVELGRWGFGGGSSSQRKATRTLINARAETVWWKQTFSDAFNRRRCLVLADGFFEWRQEGERKVPYFIRLKGGEPFAFAGIYNLDENWLPLFAIMTTKANPLVATIHHRMPVILYPEQERRWIEDWAGIGARREARKEEARAMLRPYAADLMEAYPVSTLVNAPANDSPVVLRKAA